METWNTQRVLTVSKKKFISKFPQINRKYPHRQKAVSLGISSKYTNVTHRRTYNQQDKLNCHHSQLTNEIDIGSE